MDSGDRFTKRVSKVIGSLDRLKALGAAGRMSEGEYDEKKRDIGGELSELKAAELREIDGLIASSAKREKRGELESRRQLIDVFSDDEYAEYLRSEYLERLDLKEKGKRPLYTVGVNKQSDDDFGWMVILLVMIVGAALVLFYGQKYSADSGNQSAPLGVPESTTTSLKETCGRAYDTSVVGEGARFFIASNNTGCWVEFCENNPFTGKIQEYRDGCYFSIARMKADDGNPASALKACSFIADNSSKDYCTVRVGEGISPENRTSEGAAAIKAPQSKAAREAYGHDFEYDVIMKIISGNETPKTIAE